MSVTNPGLSISVPPTRISAPSASSRPASGPVERRAQRLPRPARPRARSARRRRCCRRSAAGSSTTAPIDLADLDDHVDLDQRHQHERRDQQPPREPSPRRAALQRLSEQTARCSAPLGDRRPRSWSARSRRPQRVIRRSDSVATCAAHLRVAPHPLHELDRHLDARAARRAGVRNARSVWKT